MKMDPKKELMRKIYRWGFGDLLNEIFGLVEYINKYNEGLEKIPEIMGLYQKLIEHYDSIDEILKKHKNDKELVNVRNCKRKLPKLGTLLTKFKEKPASKKTTKEILDLIIELRDEGEKFRTHARKYGVQSGDMTLRLS